MQSAAAAPATWWREPALSPDGQWLAFRADGDLFVASVNGGEARLLRGTSAHEHSPTWSPDGRQVVFAADPDGNDDVFSIDAQGKQEPRRLTWHSRNEIPVAVAPDGQSVLIRSGRLDLSASRAVYPLQLRDRDDLEKHRPWTALFALPLHGGLPRMLIEPSVMDAGWAANGTRLMFSVRPGSEYIYRKHERSAATWDLWMSDADGNSPRRLTHIEGHDTAPRWNQADGHIYFLSERSGSFNVWRMSEQGEADARQITHHKRDPVRDLTVSSTGRIAYSFQGGVYVGSVGVGFRPLSLRLPTRQPLVQPALQDLSASLRQASRVPGRDEVVVVARGEVYVLDPLSQRSQRLLSDWPGVKSWPTFSADGRQLLVVRNRGNVSDLLLTQLPEGTQSWLEAGRQARVVALASMREEVIIRAGISPDGRQAVFTTGRDLRVVQIADRTVRHLLSALAGLDKYDQPLVWHPNSVHLAIHFRTLKRRSSDIAVLSTQDGSLLNVSQSGFDEADPQWSADGRRLVWQSDRDGMRAFTVHNTASDAFVLELDPQRRRAEVIAARQAPTSVTGAVHRVAVPATNDELAAWIDALRQQPDRLQGERTRLTATSALVRAMGLAPSARFLLQLREVGGHTELWRTSFAAAGGRSDEQRIARLPGSPPGGSALVDVDPKSISVPSIEIGSDERDALLVVDGVGYWADLSSGKLTQLALPQMPVEDGREQRRWLFEHVVRTVDRVYYRPEFLAQIRWPEYVSAYRGLLPAVSDPATFSEFMNELLGELQGSHTYFHHQPQRTSVRSGSLGVIYDAMHAAEGWRIAEILPGSPLDGVVHEGERIVEIDGAVIPAGSDPAKWLRGTVGRVLSLQVVSPEGKRRAVHALAIGNAEEASAMYRRWVAWQRRETDTLSGGKLGYVHMSAMGEQPFRALVEDVLGRFVGKQGIVFDTRFNQGGWMHEPLMTFFSTPHFFDLEGVGRIYASEPALRAGRPVVVLMNAGNYSNGSEVPTLFQEHGVAKLVGEPYASSGLGGHSDPLPFPEYRYGVAHDACLTADGHYWENTTQQPDVNVRSDRIGLRAGRDAQLAAAVQVLLQADAAARSEQLLENRSAR
ncbi:S41 family peptidase [Steroidobacter sp.]|uniref:S41 family peptidase n=1 Tax=Steroidobacter sp. TaxID=1978227 RepID=UPI001A4E893B|nr:S41 family peptidase [Steroidobacter sp.]MBL8264854.1 PD40 domain-containing protein [Steroidobacter sp.]